MVQDRTGEQMLHGRFLGTDGTPIVGAGIEVYPLGQSIHDESALAQSLAFTDRHGSFGIDLALLAGRLAFWQSPCGENTGFLLVCARDGRTVGHRILTLGEARGGPIEVRTWDRGPVTSRITCTDGRGIPGAAVTVSAYRVRVAGAPGEPYTEVQFTLCSGEVLPGGSYQPLEDVRGASGEDGCFEIPNVPLSSAGLTLTLSHPEYGRLDDVACTPGGEPVSAVLRRAASIVFKASQADGSPAADMGLCLVRHSSGPFCTIHREGTTDEEGRAAFDELNPGRYEILARTSSEAPVRWVFPAVHIADLAEGTTSHVDVEVVKGCMVSGRVVDGRTGEALPGAKVAFTNEAQPTRHVCGYGMQSVKCDESGRFALAVPVAPGKTQFRAMASKGGEFLGGQFDVEIEGGDRLSIEFRLTPDGGEVKSGTDEGGTDCVAGTGE